MISQQHMLCGDEVKAIVADIGSYHCKFGTSGQDIPRHIFRSDIGYFDEESKYQKPVHGSTGFRFLRDDLSIQSLATTSDSGEHIGQLIRHGVADQLRLNAEEYPIMIAHSRSLLQPDSAQKMMEFCLESEDFPAMYMASSASLSAFSAGRSCSLVVDIGAAGTSIVPVVDGYELRGASIRTVRGGDALDARVRVAAEHTLGGPIVPWFDTARSAHAAAGFKLSPSFRELHINDVARDIKHWMCFVPHRPLPLSEREAFYKHTYRLPPSYELPDGTILDAADYLSTAPERLFFGASVTGGDNIAVDAQLRKRCRELMEAPASGTGFDVETESLTTLVYASVSQCDVDTRRELLSNLQIVGGGSLTDGIAQRLVHELSAITPSHMKVKASAALPIERQNAAWIGGSVLSICGSFQQRWLSRAEYHEQGPLRSASRFDH